MRSPFFVSRLAGFTISLLLLGQSIESGWGVEPAWGWYLAIVLLTLLTLTDLLSLVTCTIAFLLLIGVIDDGRPAFIALSIFSGAAMIRRLIPGANDEHYVRSGAWRWGPRRAAE